MLDLLREVFLVGIPCSTILITSLIFVKYKTLTKCEHEWEVISKNYDGFGDQTLLLKCKKCGKIEKHTI